MLPRREEPADGQDRRTAIAGTHSRSIRLTRLSREPMISGTQPLFKGSPMPRTSTLLLSLVVVTGVPIVNAMTADQENENPRATSTTRPGDHGPPPRRELDEAAGDRRRGADARSGRQRVRRDRRRPRRPRARRSGHERLRRRRGRAHLRRESEESRLDQRRRPGAEARDDRVVQEDTRTAGFRRTTRCSRRSCRARSTRGTRCSIAGAR